MNFNELIEALKDKTKKGRYISWWPEYYIKMHEDGIIYQYENDICEEPYINCYSVEDLEKDNWRIME